MSSNNTDLESFELRLGEIRARKTSKLDYQSRPALILSAVEESLAEEHTETTPAAYFVSLLALLDQCFADEEISDSDLANAVVYLLNVVTPFVSSPLMRSKFTDIVSRLVVVLSHPESDTALLRSSIGVLERMLLDQDLTAWSASTAHMSPKRAMMGLMVLALDPRPKVRKRAQEAVYNIIKNPPPGPKLEHPCSEICAEMALDSLQKSLKNNDNAAKPINALNLVKMICAANGWPITRVEDLCETLLEITRSTDQYVIVVVFQVLEVVFQTITDETDAPKMIKIVDSIFTFTPSIKDQHLAPAWLAVVAQACAGYSALVPMKAFNSLPKVFEKVVKFLDAETTENIHISAAECLIALIHTAIPDEALLSDHLASNKKSKDKDTVNKKAADKSDDVLAKLGNMVFGLMHIRYHGSWNEITDVLVALFDRLRWKADPHLIKSLKVVGVLRAQREFEDGREGCDKIIAAAIRALGPEKVIELLPMNLVPNKNQQQDAATATRAWMLPLLRDNIQFPTLGHFKKYFLPLSERVTIRIQELEDLIAEGSAQTAPVQLKIYQALYDQIWSLLPRYLDLPFDLQESFDQEFAEKLANVLYQEIELRPVVCQSLRLLVESNVAYSEGAVDDDVVLLQRFPKSKATKNLKYIEKNFAPKMLSVLFNVFVQTPADTRGYVLETIIAYLGITSAKDLDESFNKISKVLHDALEKGDSVLGNSMMDLVVAMTPFLPDISHGTLLTIFTTIVPLSKEPQMQKKAFRIVTKLSQTEDGLKTIEKYIKNIEKLFVDLTEKVTAPSRGARLQAISSILEVLPDSDLHFIPAILSETVLATKDVNEKTRKEAFDLLIKLGQKLQKGGVVDMTQLYGDEAGQVEASLEEYFTMLSAGLAGSTPHMISATITALSRVLFEFREDLDMNVMKDLSSTVELFLTSQNREIVKSTLGFVKITVVSLPTDVVENNLKEFIEHLLVWSHEHKAHFKAKVKHIIERLVRRFGYEKIAENFPEEDRKLLTNIRKTRDRAKRKAKEGENGAADEGPSKPKTKFANEFDEALYGSSDSDSGSDEDEDEDMEVDEKKPTKNSHNNHKKAAARYIVEGTDEPLDLLDQSSLGKIVSSKPSKAHDSKNLKLKNKFAEDPEGRIVVKDNSEEEEVDLDNKDGISAYISAVKSGPVRGQRNKLKYKRARKFRNDEGDDDDEDGFDDDFKRPKQQPDRKKLKSARPMKVKPTRRKL